MKCTNHFKPFGLLFFLCLIPLWISAQTISVTGIVKDVAGEPVIGASVLQKARRTVRLLISTDGSH